VGALCLALAAAGCAGKSTATTTVTTTATATSFTVTTYGRFHYRPVLVTNFMRTCTQGNKVKEAYCACTLDKLSNNVSTQDFARIGLAGGKVSPRIRRFIRQATVACANKL
jgi:hypothetical protein